MNKKFISIIILLFTLILVSCTTVETEESSKELPLVQEEIIEELETNEDPSIDSELEEESNPTEEVIEDIVEPEEIIEEVIEVKEKMIEGKTLSERLSLLKSNLHEQGSGKEAKEFFPDLLEVYTEENNPDFPQQFLPFRYYYSEEADVTVNICDVDFTLFVCEGKLDRKLEESDYGNCEIVEQYKNPETIPFNK